MGFNNSLIAVKSHKLKDILKGLKLRKKKTQKKPEEFYARHSDNEIVGGIFNSDWYIIMDGTWEIFKNHQLVKQFSKDFEVLIGGIGEGWMASSLSCWREGKNVWYVNHELDRGLNHLEEQGELPKVFEEIKARIVSDHESTPEEMRCDNYFSIPTELLSELVGFDYCDYYPNDSKAFEYLELAPDFPKIKPSLASEGEVEIRLVKRASWGGSNDIDS